MTVKQLYTEVEKLLQQHNVTLTDAMLIGQHIVTNAQVGLVLASLDNLKMMKDEATKDNQGQ